jgi:two-component system, NarL family, invasion response regulator UvrY
VFTRPLPPFCRGIRECTLNSSSSSLWLTVPMYAVLIVDDHAVVRAGFRQFLESDPRIHRIEEASSAGEALFMLRREHWDVVLLDILLPDRNGLDIVSDIRDADVDTKILITSCLPEDQFAMHAFRLGADGYLNKASAPEELIKAVRAVLAGREYLSESLARTLKPTEKPSGDGPLHQRLSPREFQILCKLAAGQRIAIIAKDLDLNSRTISTYRARIFEKMHFGSNADIIAYAFRQGLIL